MATPQDDREPQPRGNLALIQVQIAHLTGTMEAGFNRINERITELRGDLTNHDARINALELWQASEKAREQARLEANERLEQKQRAAMEQQRLDQEHENAALIPVALKVLGAVVALAAAVLGGT